jgi:hypothetical protein
MAIVITGTVIVDESSGTQNATDGSPADASGNDVAFGNLPDTFEDILGPAGLNLDTAAATTSVAVSGGNADISTGTAMITGLPVGYTDIGWTTVGGAPLDGADSGLDTTDGTSILLYTYSGDNNVLLGRAGGPTGDIVFAAYLEEINGTEAKVWLVQFASMFNDVNPNPDDPVSPLQNVMYIGVSQNLEFSLEDAPSGSNLFLMFGTPGDGDPTNGDEVSLVVTATNAASGGGVVSSQGGGGTTLGVNNQMLDPGEGLTFTFVTNSASNLTVPELSETEADVEGNIQFGGVLQDATSASFLVVQNQPASKSSTLTLTAYLTDAESGVGFIAGYGDDTQVAITSVTVTNPDVTVTNNGDGTFTLIGLKAGDQVTYVTESEHNRVTIENDGVKNSKTGAAFDIGDFQVITPAVQPFEFHQMAFQDDGPTLAFGNLVGTGSALAQTGFWSMDPGADGLDTSLGNNGLELVLNWFSLDGGTTHVAPTLFQSDGVDLDGNFLFSGTLTGDFDKNSGTDPTGIDFTLLADLDGHYELTIEGGFGSVIDFDTAEGQLRAGGPDAVQTLDIPPPPNAEISVVFFSAKALANAADIQAGLDQTESDLESASPPPSYIDFARGMNVSTSGIGVANNLLEGTGTTAGVGGITAADESFVIDPNEPVSSMEIFVDNSVGGYAVSATGDKHEELYYRVYYEDGTSDDNLTLVDDDLGLKNQPNSFVIDGGEKQIDAVQLIMNVGAVKIPHIVFQQETTSLASDILLDFTATIHDADGLSGGDPATSNFSVDLQTNELSGSDFVLAGTTGEADAFNIDLASDLNTYEVTGFELGTDIFVLIGDATATISITDDGTDSTVTINETDPAALDTTITVADVIGLDATTDFVFG